MKKTCGNPSCQHRFTANRFNIHDHLYCGLPECRRYRDRIRKRRSRHKHPPDAEFRAQEVKRMQEYRKGKKETAGTVPACRSVNSVVASHPPSPSLITLVEEQTMILTGLAVQLGGFSDRQSVTDFLGRCRKRGRELCATGSDSP